MSIESSLHICQTAQDYFTTNSRDAANYLINRKISKETQERFGIGYCSNSYTLVSKLSRMADYGELQESGIVQRNKDNRLYTFFHQRIMAPIRNWKGETISFSGRQLNEDKKYPKYINGRESNIFSKEESLFGIDQAFIPIIEKRYVYICEGNFDVLACHDSGLHNTVGVLGTSLTPKHILILKTLGVKNIYLMFDNDEPGDRACERAMKMIEKFGLSGKRIRLKEHDASDHLAKHGQFTVFRDAEMQIEEHIA